MSILSKRIKKLKKVIGNKKNTHIQKHRVRAKWGHVISKKKEDFITMIIIGTSRNERKIFKY